MTPLKNNETTTPRVHKVILDGRTGGDHLKSKDQVSGKWFIVRQLIKRFQPQVKNVTETVDREPRQGSGLTPLAAPPQKPPRTFAHDAYLKKQDQIKELKQLDQSIPSRKCQSTFYH